MREACDHGILTLLILCKYRISVGKRVDYYCESLLLCVCSNVLRLWFSHCSMSCFMGVEKHDRSLYNIAHMITVTKKGGVNLT